MPRTEIIEFSGHTLRAQELEEGRWVGEVVERAVPQLTATSLDNLEEQFKSVIGALAKNEAAVEGMGLDTRQDAMMHQLHLNPMMGVAETEADGDYQPPEPGEDISRERWED